MIKNEKQYQVTSKRLKEFSLALEKLTQKEDIDPDLKEIQINALKAQIEIFQDEINEFLLLKKKQKRHLVVNKLAELPEVLIKARIARGLSQNDLAVKMHIKEQQIQRYEADNYESAGWLRIVEVANELQINFKTIKAELDVEDFLIPEGLDIETIDKVQDRLNSERTLLPVN
jgi:transcriptional regulator with XRE-family HTH domain